MRGRVQAIIVALIGSWIPFVSQAVLGLVTLRRGWQEGLIISLWASLPAFAGLWLGQVPVPMALASIAVFFVGFICCVVLRQSISWPLTLSAVALVSSAAAVLIAVSQPGLAEDVKSFFASLLQGGETQLAPELKALADGWNTVSSSGLIAYWIAVSTVIGLLLARWWQALLYNPGGFQQEFHSLRLTPQVALLFSVLAIAATGAGSQYQFWSGLCTLPLIFAGLGLLHWLVAQKAWPVGALVGIYLALLIIPVSALLVMLLALLDAVLDLRKKFNTSQSS
ncbi:hypothetical protein [Agaribacterium haliotis]|uniref:hypothetical protein n=1 Tax=Agaribacterium haliotis TaxID=2013869 RepID=UPI0011778AF4|nr:hypothetical protein [Agaribacterium haliotis]